MMNSEEEQQKQDVECYKIVIKKNNSKRGMVKSEEDNRNRSMMNSEEDDNRNRKMMNYSEEEQQNPRDGE